MTLSIARAGKVKHQTPKVIVCDKKKKPLGRKKKRIQYNKRILQGITGNKLEHTRI